MTADLGADERRIRRLLRERGVGPDAINPPEPAEENTAEAIPYGLFDLPDAVAEPITPPPAEDVDQAQHEEPAAGRRSWRSRLPDWRTGQTVSLSKDDEDEQTETTGKPDTAGSETTDPDPDGTDEPEDADVEEQPDDKPLPKQPSPGRRRFGSPAGASHEAAAGLNRRLRAIAFNGTAAAAGYALGLNTPMGAYLPHAQQAATNLLAVVLAGAAGWCAWKASGSETFRGVWQAPPAVRLLLAAGAAELGRRAAPMGVPFLADLTAAVGLDRQQTALIITVSTMCGGLWWAIDRPARRRHWTIRWLARIPLASALVAVALYAPGH